MDPVAAVSKGIAVISRACADIGNDRTGFEAQQAGYGLNNPAVRSPVAIKILTD